MRNAALMTTSAIILVITADSKASAQSLAPRTPISAVAEVAP